MMKDRAHKKIPFRFHRNFVFAALWALAFSSSAMADAITFADPKLEAAVRRAVPATGDNALEPDDLRDLTILRASGLGITRLDGLEHATALQHLDLSLNQIEDLSPLAGLTQLRHLDLGCGMPMNGDDDKLRLSPANRVANLDPLADLNQLSYLNLAGNEALRDISVLGALEALRILWLGHAAIDDYGPLRKLSALRTLGIFHGALQNTDLDHIGSLTDLESLCLYENPAVTDLSPLAELNPVRADFDTLDLADLSPMRGWTNLEWLNISSSKLHDIHPLASLSTLAVLRLDDNDIEDITALQSMNELRELDLGENRIRVVDALADHDSLALLYLDHNQIERIAPLSSLGALEELDIEYNQAIGFDAVAGLPALQELIANHNAFEDLSAARANAHFGRFEYHVLEISHNPWNAYSRCTVLPELVQRFNAAGAELEYGHGCGTFYHLTVKREGKGEVFPEPGRYWLQAGGGDVLVAAYPLPDSGYAFSHFEGAGRTELGKRAVPMDGDHEVTAVFVEGGHVLDIRTAGSPFGRTFPDAGSYRYADGVEVLVGLNAEHDKFFGGWHGAKESWGKSVSLSMDSDKEIVAEFQYTGFELSVSYTGYGAVAPLPDRYSIAAGSVVRLEATPLHVQWPFIEWEGDLDQGTDAKAPTLEVVMDHPRAITAVFDARYSLTIAVEGKGTTVPEAGRHAVEPAQRSEITATPPEDMSYLFHHWEGDLHGADPHQPAISLVNQAETEVTAVFSPARALHVAIEGKGSTMPEAGTHHYFQDTSVVLKALPVEDWAFDHWTGDPFPEPRAENSVTADLATDQNVTACFSPADYNLTLTHTGNGTGNTYPPEGVYGYKQGQSVTIEASRGDSAYFLRWHGDIGTRSAFAPRLTLSMESARNITAEFVAEHTFTIAVRGAGGTTNPVPGIYHAKDGSDIRVTAIVEDGVATEFSHWEYGADGVRAEAALLKLKLSSDLTATAVFVPKPKSGEPAAGHAAPAD